MSVYLFVCFVRSLNLSSRAVCVARRRPGAPPGRVENAPRLSLERLSLEQGAASRKMHYYRYSSAEVSCWYKYLLFSYNIVFWLAGVVFLGVGLWAWSEKGVLSDLTKVTRMHGIDPVVLVLMVGVVMFTLGFAGCVGALRENICLLKFFCGAIVLIFFLELAVAVLAFLFQDWVRDRFREFFESNIRSYRDDIDLQNLIDSLQKANQCCGAYGPEDWDLNVYFNCSGASYSREKCGVPFSCCVPDPAQKVVNTQCGYDVRTQLKGKWEESIFTKGCIPALEGWLPRNIYIVAGVFIAISLLQIFGIFLARTLISDIEAVKAGHHF
uniref:Tetraspanin 14 n=1 Tax=Equus asinus TaxID=9793 RepID=A0A9L0J4P6_EQUAS